MNKFNKLKFSMLGFLMIILLFPSMVTNVCASENNRGDSVYLGGESFGIKMFTKGAVVVKFEDFMCQNRSVCPAKSSGIKTNDNIIKADGCSIENNEQLENIITHSNGQEITMTVLRSGDTVEISVTPKEDKNGIYKIGAWIRDSCAGIGTISFYNDNGEFAALGHGICDSDTGQLMEISGGTTVKAKINGINKAMPGTAGSLNGYFEKDEIGSIKENTPLGIFGCVNFIPQKDKIMIADIKEVKCGEAVLHTTIDDTGVQDFSVEIESIGDKSCNTNKNFVIKITDNRLLNVTGGIVQGMSGSPITQEGKLVGVLNHVFVNTPEKGYCVFAQNMVSNISN